MAKHRANQFLIYDYCLFQRHSAILELRIYLPDFIMDV